MHQAVVGPQRCGAGPHLVIEIFGGLGIGRIALGAHVVVTIDLDQTDVTEPPLANDVVARFDQVRCAAALRSHLHDASVLARGGHHCLALDHVHADGLLTPHVGARLDRGNHGERVPVIGRVDEDDVEILLGEHLAIIGIGARTVLRRLALRHSIGRVRQHLLIHIAHRDDLDGRDLDQTKQVGFAVPARSDDADTRLLGPGSLASQVVSGQSEDCGAVEQELSAIHGSPPSNGCEYTSSHGRSNRRSPPPATRPTLSSESDRNLAVDRPGYRRNSLVPVMPSRYKHI